MTVSVDRPSGAPCRKIESHNYSIAHSVAIIHGHIFCAGAPACSPRIDLLFWTHLTLPGLLCQLSFPGCLRSGLNVTISPRCHRAEGVSWPDQGFPPPPFFSPSKHFKSCSYLVKFAATLTKRHMASVQGISHSLFNCRKRVSSSDRRVPIEGPERLHTA